MIKPQEEKCVDKKFYKRMQDYAKHLMTFWKMGVLRSINNIKSKLEDQGRTCMFLGYAQKYTGSTYIMLNLFTKRIVLSRGVICLNKTYDEYVPRKKTQGDQLYPLRCRRVL